MRKRSRFNAGDGRHVFIAFDFSMFFARTRRYLEALGGRYQER